MASVVAAWPTVALGEVLQPISRPVRVEPAQTYPVLGMHWYAEGLYIKDRKPGSQIQADTVYEVREGDFVYNRLFAWKGSFGVAGPDVAGCYVSNEFPCFRVNAARLMPQFLHLYFSQSRVWDEAQGSSSGSTPTSRLRLKEPQFLAMEVPLPPLDEQRRIVGRIEALAARIAQARGLRREAMAEGEHLAFAAARDALSHKDAPITPLVRWLDESRDGIQTGPFGAQLSSTDFVSRGVPLLTIGNVHYGGLATGDLKYVSDIKAAQLSRFRIREGDLLFARMGTVGRCCVVPSSADGWLINYHIIRVALDKAQVEPRYIHWTIRTSQDVEKYLDDKTRGATRAGVNSSIVAKIPCRIPALSEQRRIVAYLDDVQARVDALKRLQAETAAELDALLPAVLDQAFRGEL